MASHEAWCRCCRRPWSGQACEEVSRARRSDPRCIQYRGRKCMRLFKTQHLFTERNNVGAERIEHRRGVIVAIVHGIDARKRIASRENMIEAHRSKILTD